MNKNYKIFSFDVYDTCISRTYEKPSDLFYHLGKYICAQKNPAHCEKFAYEFYKARALAEKLACRQHGRRRSCRLHEIYSILSIPAGCRYSKSEIMDFELHFEDQFTYGIKATKNIIDKLRNEGSRIIFISDMYLDASFIKRQLTKHGFFEDGDGLYVSSESTLLKRTGMLFKLALQNEKAQAQELFHTGDNFACDIRPANKIGIKTAHIQDTHIPFHEMTFCDPKFTPIERRINSIPKYIRLSDPNAFTNAELKLFSIIAPAIISFTLWSLQTAKNMGLKRLYFVSRNGELPYKTAKLFQHYFPQIEVKFLYGSRRAWLLPSISIQDPDWTYVMPKKSTCSIREILQRLALEEDEISVIGSTASANGLSICSIEKSSTTLKNFINLLKLNEIKKTIFEKINHAKEFTVEYLNQEGLLQDDRWAIVDSGWELNCQSHLNRIVKSISPDLEAKGFYFGMSPKHLPVNVTGPATSFTEKLSIFSQRGYVVENCFLFSALQSTCGYTRDEDKITPDFSKLSHSSFELNYSDKIYSYIESYVKALNSIEIPASLFVAHKKQFVENLANLVSNPDIDIAHYLSSLKINEDLKHDDQNSYPLCRKLFIKDLKSQVIGFFFTKVKRQQIWLEASICMSAPIVAFLFRSLIFINRMRYIISNLPARSREYDN